MAVVHGKLMFHLSFNQTDWPFKLDVIKKTMITNEL